MSADDRREVWQGLRDVAFGIYLREGAYTRRWELALNVWGKICDLMEAA